MSITGSNLDEWPLIPRERLLGNPSRIDPKLSPDGSRLAWQAPVDLVTLMENRPPSWADFMEQFHRRYADVRTEEGRAFLRSRSPLYKADQIRKPMLIGHGANDVRCTLAQSDAIVAAIQKLGLPVTYVVFPDEGHGFARSENNLAFSAIVEAFFARWLGGRAEPRGGLRGLES